MVNPQADDLHVKVVDTAHGDKLIGLAVISLSDILNKDSMELENQPFFLKVTSFFPDAATALS